MKRLKTFLIYGLIIAGFWILSDLLINVGTNSMYEPIKRLDNTEQIEIFQAEATLVNGRIKGMIKNSEQNNIANKYVKLELYSDSGNEIGTRYIPIEELATDSTKPIDLHFKIDHVESYKLTIVDEKGPEEGIEINLLPKDLTKGEIIWGVLIVLMLW